MAKHIDDLQPPTVTEHFEALMNDKSFIDEEYSQITSSDFPQWYNSDLFKEGQNYLRRNIFSNVVATICGLIAIISIPSVSKILQFTKQSSNSSIAFKRYVETYIHMYNLIIYDVDDKESDFYKSLNVIRQKHSTASKRAVQNKISGISQKDMILTQWSFIGYILINGDKLGMTNKLKEREAFNHMWRILGNMLGIPDRLNICRKYEAETTELCKIIAKEVFAKYMEKYQSDFIEMSEIIGDALWNVDPTVNTDAILTLTYELTGLQYKKPLSLISSLSVKYYKFIICLFSVPYLGGIIRVCYNKVVPFTLWISKNYPICAWLRYGKEFKPIVLYLKSNEYKN